MSRLAVAIAAALSVAKFPSAFADDADLAKTSFMAASQVPWGQAAIAARITNPAWKTKPTFYLVTTNDHMVPTPAQRQMAARAKAKVTEVASSHAVMLSHPAAVVSFIEHAAETHASRAAR